MFIQKYLLLFFGSLMAFAANSQKVINTSYINESGEKVLQLEITLPLTTEAAWKLFTEDEKLQKWIAPLAHIELRSGGYIVTNYDSSKSLSDSSSIRLPILSFIENELIILKVNLNDHFPVSARNTDQNLQEVIQFKKAGEDHTHIISSMIGWGKGDDWDKTYLFFEKGNTWTFEELIKYVKQ